MSTRSFIGISKDGITAKVIYCHWDGYPSYMGRILMEHYKDEKKVEELISNGDMSFIGKDIGKKHSFDEYYRDPKYREKHENECMFYGRDRGDEHVSAHTWPIKEAWTEDYNYLFKNGKWYYRKGRTKRWLLLTEKTIEKDS